MSLSNLTKKALSISAYIFSFAVILFSLGLIIFEDRLGMNPVTVFCLFPFIFCVVFSSLIVKYTQLKTFPKLAIHFIIFTLSIVLFIFIPNGGGVSSGTALILFAIYFVIYTLCAAICIIVNSKKMAKKQKTAEYKKVY